ncbi:MAG: hypothetical protein SZ59_C0004G0038 [candidate division TM6 bacterium GW2011_GWF2_28_16]|nr:MAG: hypothetical protein SZ59_C0004G0038 [candidate division TM6 bacterium GW2011_GWF2_28_16]
MEDKILKKYIIRSFWIHITIILIALFTGLYNKKIDKHFLVYGAHSKIPTQALFKSNKENKQTNWYAKRIAQEKELKEKRNAKIKAEKARKAKIEAQKKAKILSSQAKTRDLELAKQKKLEQESKIKESQEKKKKKVKQKKEEKPKKIDQKKEKAQEPEQAPEPEKELEPEITPENNIQENQELVFNLEETGEQDPNLKAAGEQIKGIVKTTWHPPVGVPKGTECKLKLATDSNGNVTEFNFTEKSNILIYDLSIINAIKQFKFYGFLCGKIFTIDFRQ